MLTMSNNQRRWENVHNHAHTLTQSFLERKNTTQHDLLYTFIQYGVQEIILSVA